MKVDVNEDGEIRFENVYNSIVVKTGDGVYGICERDGKLTIVKQGKEVWRS